MKKAILFVDDEPNILSGIRRMLRAMRNEYDFFFAESGKEALGIMEEENIRVIVSDMRMPEMDGVTLLENVRRKKPHVIRIMLTGQADNKSVLSTVSVVHQFLSKPCDSEQLKDVIKRSSALLDQIHNDRLRNIIAGIDSLPSLPSVFARLQEVLNDPESTADQVAAVIEQDVAMTAKLLQLVNSSFFGLFKKVESPDRAVKLLGLETVKILVLGVQIFSEMKTSNQQIRLDYLWKHSMSVANCSKIVARDATNDDDLINNAFIAGLLHDIGRLLLVSKMGEDYEPAVKEAAEENASLLEKEAQHLGATHADIGAYLIGLWGFAGDIVEAIAFHNDIACYPAPSFSPALAVHIADAAYYSKYPEDGIGQPATLDEAHLERLGLSEKREHWEQLCIAELEKYDDAD